MDLDKLYEYFDEDKRLNTNNSNRVEFMTTITFIEKYLRNGMKVIDIGAGTGIYSIYYAEKGYDVTAVEPVKRNVEIIRAKAAMGDINIQIQQANALDLSHFEDESFDIVLCLGPIYHMDSDIEKKKCIEETKRICKNKGKIFYAYLSNDMVFVTEVMNNKKYLSGALYDPETFLLKGVPFCFMTVNYMKQLIRESNLEEVSQFAADGLSELLSDKINAFNEQEFEEWFRFHLYTCEKKELIGYSNHIVLIAQK